MTDQACPRFVADYPRHVAADLPRKAAFICESETLDFGDLASRAARIGEELRKRGVHPGDRVACLGRNSLHLVSALFGILQARAIFMPLNWRLSGAEMIEIIEDTTPAFLFVDEEFVPMIHPATMPLDSERRLCIMDRAIGGLADWYGLPEPTSAPDGFEDDDVIFHLCTSGTTGKPKGVLVTNRNMKEQRDSEAVAFGEVLWRPNDVSIASAPMYNIGGLNWCLEGLSYGLTYVILQAFRAGELLETIAKHGVTQLFAIPAIIGELSELQAERQYDVTSLRAIHYGSAPIAPVRLAEAMKQFNCAFLQCYGSTEGCGSKFVLPPSEHRLDRPDRLESCGRAMPGVETRVLGADGEVVAPGEEGELQLRSVAIARKYWRDGGLEDILDVDGWLATGDVGKMDSDGFFHILARKKDVIISGGTNIYPADVENAVAELPGIRECAVIGVPDLRWGEAVKAIVVVEPGHAFDAEAAREALRATLAGYKIPKTFDLIAQLPRNPIGKVDRVALRDPYWAAEHRKVG